MKALLRCCRTMAQWPSPVCLRNITQKIIFIYIVMQVIFSGVWLSTTLPIAIDNDYIFFFLSLLLINKYKHLIFVGYQILRICSKLIVQLLFWNFPITFLLSATKHNRFIVSILSHDITKIFSYYIFTVFLVSRYSGGAMKSKKFLPARTFNTKPWGTSRS